MKTPREQAEEVVEGYRTDELTGRAPGIDLTDRIEVAIADALKETREACARICDERAKRYAAKGWRVSSFEAESCAAAIRAGDQS